MSFDQQRREVDRNYAAFMAKLSSLLPEHANRWALMRDGEIVEVHDTVGAAYDAGKARFPDQRYSIQEITAEPIDLGFWSHAAPH